MEQIGNILGFAACFLCGALLWYYKSPLQTAVNDGCGCLRPMALVGQSLILITKIKSAHRKYIAR